RQRTPAREVLSAEMFASGADQFLVIHGNARVELPRMAPVHYLRRVRAPGLADHERIAPRRCPIHLHGVRRHLPALAPTELDAARLVRLHARVEHILGHDVVAHDSSLMIALPMISGICGTTAFPRLRRRSTRAGTP